MTWEKRKVNSKVYLKYVHCGHDFYVMMFLSIIFSASVQLSLNQQGTGRVEQHLINMVLDGVTVLFVLKFHIMCQWGRYKLWVSTSISGLIFTSLPFVVMLQANQFSKNAFQMGKDPVFLQNRLPPIADHNYYLIDMFPIDGALSQFHKNSFHFLTSDTSTAGRRDTLHKR